MNHNFPHQLQADNIDATDAACDCMVHIFDAKSEIAAFRAFSRSFRHVVIYDNAGFIVDQYDNR